MSSYHPNDNQIHKKSGSSLLDLRIALLQTIAYVWKHGEDARQILQAKDAKEVTEWLKNGPISFTMPYKNFGVRFLKTQAKWDLYGDRQWTKPQKELITITLPAIPAGANWDQYTKAEKLMEYYKYYQTFLGPAKTGAKVESNGGNSPPQIDLHGNDYNLGLSSDNFQAFSAVLIKLIAALWDSHELYNHIDYGKKDKDVSPDEYFKNIDRILKTFFQYGSSWDFNFKFLVPIQSEDQYWLLNNGEWEWNNAPIIRNWVSIELPATPAADKNNVSLALARYNAIGPAYPFTYVEWAHAFCAHAGLKAYTRGYYHAHPYP